LQQQTLKEKFSFPNPLGLQNGQNWSRGRNLGDFSKQSIQKVGSGSTRMQCLDRSSSNREKDVPIFLNEANALEENI